MIKSVYFKETTEEKLEYLQSKLKLNASATIEYALNLCVDFFQNKKLAEGMSIESVCEFLKSLK